MSDILSDPPRWKDRLDQANVAEREAGRAVRSMTTPEPLPAARLARIAARIRDGRPRRRTFWLTVTAALLLGGATVASAAHLNVLPGWLQRIAKPKPVENVTPKRASLGPARKLRGEAVAAVPALPEATSHAAEPVPESSTATMAPLLERPAAKSAEAKPPVRAASRERTAEFDAPKSPLTEPAKMVDVPPVGTTHREARVAIVATLDRPVTPNPTQPTRSVTAKDMGAVSATETSSLQEAAKSLTLAIRALRVERSPSAALSLLESHGALLAKSPFAHEALLLRVEAMLALGRKGEVLRLLDGAVLTDVAASRSLLITRGELRATVNRCAEGLGDFDQVLAGAKQADRQALFGRAMCRKKVGDKAGARADVERYRREFPTDARLGDLERQVRAAPQSKQQ
jgi:hypothetical protein